MPWKVRLNVMSDCQSVITVAIGVLVHQASVLLTQRKPGSPCEGQWEFPGGKLERGETLPQCLTRELQEELGIQVLQSEWLCQVSHKYPHGTVEMSCWLVYQYAGELSPQEGQPMQWVPIDALPDIDMPAANRVIVDRLSQSISSVDSPTSL